MVEDNDYSFSWEPQKGVLIVLDDKTADPRTKEELSKMIFQIKQVAKKYGFGLSSWGNDSNYEKSQTVYSSFKKIIDSSN